MDTFGGDDFLQSLLRDRTNPEFKTNVTCTPFSTLSQAICFNSELNVPKASTSLLKLITPQAAGLYPKTQLRKISTFSRKQRKCRILTDKPEKKEKENKNNNKQER